MWTPGSRGAPWLWNVLWILQIHRLNPRFHIFLTLLRSSEFPGQRSRLRASFSWLAPLTTSLDSPGGLPGSRETPWSGSRPWNKQNKHFGGGGGETAAKNTIAVEKERGQSVEREGNRGAWRGCLCTKMRGFWCNIFFPLLLGVKKTENRFLPCWWGSRKPKTRPG